MASTAPHQYTPDQLLLLSSPLQWLEKDLNTITQTCSQAVGNNIHPNDLLQKVVDVQKLPEQSTERKVLDILMLNDAQQSLINEVRQPMA